MSLCAGYDSLAAMGDEAGRRTHYDERRQRRINSAAMTEGQRRASLRADERMREWRASRSGQDGRGPKAIVYEEELLKTQEKRNGGLKKLFGALAMKKGKTTEDTIVRW